MHKNDVFYACCLASGPRWIPLEPIGRKQDRYMCSACGEVVNKKILPVLCRNCHAQMVDYSKKKGEKR